MGQTTGDHALWFGAGCTWGDLLVDMFVLTGTWPGAGEIPQTDPPGQSTEAVGALDGRQP